MVALLVVLAIIFFITIDYFIQRKEKIGLASQPQSTKLPLSKIFYTLPEGLFLQSSFTWSKILDSGNLILGIHPILLGLIGEPDALEMLEQGEKISKGQTIFKIHKGVNVLSVRSPLNGTITAINKPSSEEIKWNSINQMWLYSIKPVNVAVEIPHWFISENSRLWLNEQYTRIKNFFTNIIPQTEIGITMADGGDLPVGILSQFDEKTWQNFESEFIAPSSNLK